MNRAILKTTIRPLQKLRSETVPQWGEMSAQHMVEHLVMITRVSNGKLTVPAGYDEDRLPVLKRFLMSDKPMPRNFTNPAIGAGLKPLNFDNLEAAIHALSSEIDDFYTFYDDNPDTKTNNPTFGPLTFSEWVQFHQKHYTHHLLQFGLV